MDPFGAIFLVTFVGSLVGMWILRQRLFRQYRDGEASGRKAGWVYAALVGAPFLLAMAYMVVRSPESWWMAVLFAFLYLPVAIVPWVAAFRYPEDERRRRDRERATKQSSHETVEPDNVKERR